MTSAVTFLSSVQVSFLAHHFGEKFLTRNRKRDVRLVLKGYQVHHSFWVIVIAILGIIFTSGWLMIAILGYGLGSIWQHKYSHNQVNEKGVVFISRVLKS